MKPMSLPPCQIIFQPREASPPPVRQIMFASAEQSLINVISLTVIV